MAQILFNRVADLSTISDTEVVGRFRKLSMKTSVLRFRLSASSLRRLFGLNWTGTIGRCHCCRQHHRVGFGTLSTLFIWLG